MAVRAARPCRTPGCAGLTRTGFCDRCRAAGLHNADGRAPAYKRGYDARHRRWRLAVLARDPLCRRCELEASTVADHVVPLAYGGGWELENGQGLCRACHAAKTAGERAGKSARVVG
ncbi:MAG: HNH endonuclease [Myxococcales bacterium]|nr:HNH endonuclease [Myxococcales bacterium]